MYCTELAGGVQQGEYDEHRLPGSIASIPAAELRHVSRRWQFGGGWSTADEMRRETASLRTHAQSLGISVAFIYSTLTWGLFVNFNLN